MTIIAVKDGIMAADSFEFANDVGYPVARPKIVRAPDGSLFGCAGANMPRDAALDWVLAGMDFSARRPWITMTTRSCGSGCVRMGRCGSAITRSAPITAGLPTRLASRLRHISQRALCWQACRRPMPLRSPSVSIASMSAVQSRSSDWPSRAFPLDDQPNRERVGGRNPNRWPDPGILAKLHLI